MAGSRVETFMELPLPFPIVTPEARNLRIPRGGTRSFQSSTSLASTAAPNQDSRIDSSSSIDDHSIRPASPCEIRSPSLRDSHISSRQVLISSIVDDIVPKAPNQPRKRPQRPGHRAKGTSRKVSLSEVHRVLLEKAPQAEIAYVCIQEADAPLGSNVMSIDSPIDMATRLTNSDTVFLVVEGSQHGLNVARSALQTIRANSTRAVAVVVLVEKSDKIDWKTTAEKLAGLVHSGADDSILLPEDIIGLHSAVVVSIAKAKAFRQRRGNIEKKLTASKKQCDQLFWQIAHEVVPDFPEVRRKVREIDGKRAGNIELVGKVGEGSFASVHLGQDPQGNHMAVKVIAKENIKSIDSVLGLAREFDILRKLNHPNVVVGYSFVHCTHNLYMFMEMCGSSSLFKIIQRQDSGGLDWEQARPLMNQIADGVAYLHEMQIAHCDLKPENMVVASDAHIKIVDMGEAVDVSEEVPPLVAPKGTMPFMAPEILELCPEWNPLGTDLWSLGVIFVEVICGNNAFVRLLDWQGKDFKSLAGLRERARELRCKFGEHVRLSALSAFPELSRSTQNFSLMKLIGGLLKLCPDGRLPARQVPHELHLGD